MTPVGHAAFSYGVGRGARRWLPLSLAGTVVGGVLPDVDFLLLWAPQFNAWHRVITHNLLVCLLAALLAAAGAGWRSGRAAAVAVGLGVGLGALGHLLTDSIMDANPSNGLGVAWLWPWSDRVSGPFNLMAWLPAPSEPAGWGDPWRAARGVLVGLVVELPLWAAAGWWWWRARAAQIGSARRPGDVA